MVAITPKDEVAAVNLILRNAGETPVNSLSGEVPLEASQALATLVEVSEDVQTRGWYFNSEVYSLAPNNDGHILLPRNTLGARGWGHHRGLKVTTRGHKLYNLTPFNTGPVFTAPVQVEIVLGLPFDELPATARRYIALRAARVFQIRESGDELNAREDADDETKALCDLQAEQLAAEPLSLRRSHSVHSVTSKFPYGGY